MNSKGVTIIELLVVIVVMGIVSGFSIVMAGNIIENTRLSVDKETVNTLNSATNYYSLYNGKNTIFDETSSDSEKLQLLFTEGYVDKLITTQSKDASFEWDDENLFWYLVSDGSAIALSPYGNSFQEIVPNLIQDMQDKFEETGSYGSTWGDRRYTDLGLEKEDWDQPIMHILYTPQGNLLKLEPEEGYSFTVYNSSGTEFYMSYRYKWNIYYNTTDKNWYFHSVEPENIIDISTLVINLTPWM